MVAVRGAAAHPLIGRTARPNILQVVSSIPSSSHRVRSPSVRQGGYFAALASLRAPIFQSPDPLSALPTGSSRPVSGRKILLPGSGRLQGVETGLERAGDGVRNSVQTQNTTLISPVGGQLSETGQTQSAWQPAIDGGLNDLGSQEG